LSELWVDIDEIVLDGTGADPSDARGLAERTEAALQNMVNQRGLPSVLVSGRSATLNTLRLRGEQHGAPTAHAVAAAVYGACGQVK